MSAKGSAHGKVILLGEHACVYGTPALAVGIDRGARAEARLQDQGQTSTLALGGDVLEANGGSADDRERAFAALLAEGPASGAVNVAAESDLPAGGGLGSSAALGVAIARAVGRLFGSDDEAQALARAVAWEKVFHGNPSGIDTAVASRGGCIRFSKGHGVRPIAPPCDLWLALGWSGESSSTRKMVAHVARFRERKPELMDRSLEGVRALVENAVLALDAGDLPALGKLMDLNEMILAGLMLSTEPIESLCASARAAGALGAKLTGAGGGGSVVALSPSRAGSEGVLEAWRGRGFGGFVARVGGQAE